MKFIALLIGLLALVTLNIAPYNGNITSFFHLSEPMAEAQPVPPNFVVLQVPAYDGAQYYQIARNIPLMLDSSQWETLRSYPTTSYAYQRFLLPLTAFTLSFGQEVLFPYVFLLINILSIAGAAWLLARASKKTFYGIMLAFCPAAMVGLHFSLAEPLTLLILTAFLVRFIKHERIAPLDILLLSLLTLSREVNILFIGYLLVYLLFRKHWKDAALMIIPILVFIALHGWIYLIFHEMPFFMSTAKSTFPFAAIIPLLLGQYGYNHLTLTSIPLFLFFVLPSLIWTLHLIIKKRDFSFLTIGSFAFLALMTTMPDHIWGSITSIGRVITPVYPLTFLLAGRSDSRVARRIVFITAAIGLAAGVALALNPHPFVLS